MEVGGMNLLDPGTWKSYADAFKAGLTMEQREQFREMQEAVFQLRQENLDLQQQLANLAKLVELDGEW